MQKISATDPMASSADPIAQNREALQALYPEAFVEGQIDFEVLKQLLGGAVEEREEKFGLNWHGKRLARQIALTPSTGTLRPAPEESLDWDTTQNLMIEGDNLEVLKLLQKSYANQVKLIYIDPPYNTGKDFVYKDNFHDNIRNYLELTGQVDGAGKKITTNTEASGRFHTDWLNMMYPRLKLAKSLLAEDGVIFVNIDDNEVANLRTLMNEVFGEENFIATVIWQKVYSPKNTARHFSVDHDYILVFARSAEIWLPGSLPRTEEMEARYRNLDNDPRGPWKPSDISARNYYGEGTYSVTSPKGKVIAGPPAGRYWAVSKAKFLDLDRENRIWWGEGGNNMPSLKRFLSDVREGRVPQTFWGYKEVGHNQEGKKELNELLPTIKAEDVFDTPKPTRLIRRILELATTANGGDVVLDFFAGSGTTGDAVNAQNAAEGGNRRYICVQVPATLEAPAQLQGGEMLHTIADTTKQRLRASAAKYKAPLCEADLGFRVFKLDSTNIRAWDPTTQTLATSLAEYAEHLKADRTEQDILFEVLLKQGLSLTVPIETLSIAGHTVYNVGAGSLLACLSPAISKADTEALGLGLVELHRANPPVGEVLVLFRDSAFADDVSKTNLSAILTQNGVGNVRSV